MSDSAHPPTNSRDGEWDGLFWPAAPTRTHLAFDEIRAPFVMMVRHLPTPDTMMRAAMAFGLGSHPMLAEWRDLWHAAVGDVTAFRDASPLGKAESETSKAGHAALMMPGAPGLAATLIIAGENEKAPPDQRDETCHILEDAHVVTSLARSRLPFVLVIGPGANVPTVVAGDGPEGKRLRVVRWDGTPDEQAYHAAVAKRSRTLFGAPNPYWESPAFRRASGRPMAVAEGPHHLSLMLRDMAASGLHKAFLKSTVSKRGTWVADLAGVTDATGAALAAHVAMGASHGDLYHPHPDPRANIMVQEFLPFTHEHRFLVVGHRIVASTASDRALSVLDRHPDRIVFPGVARLCVPADAAGAYDRGRAETVADRDLTARMARKALETVRALRREGILPDCYCLDVGLTSRGVLPIEVNTVTHCGLYAANWSRVARALERRLPSGVAETETRTPVTERDPVRDGVEFLLDILADEPPMRLHEVARALMRAGDDAEAAVRAGWEARRRREAEESRPLTQEDRAWLDSVRYDGEVAEVPDGDGDQAAERAGSAPAVDARPADSSSDR